MVRVQERDAAPWATERSSAPARRPPATLAQRPTDPDMPRLLAAIPLLFAQNAPAANPNAGSGGGLGFLPFILVAILWGCFLLVRPQQQQERKRKEMIGALKKNDKV